MKAISFFVNGTPVPKARARVTRRGTFTPQKTRNYENAVRLSGALAMRGEKPFTGPLKLTVVMYFPTPKSWSKKRVAQACAGEIAPTKKPDMSNVLKSIEDALNNVVYQDDSQITEIDTQKKYWNQGRVYVEITPILTAKSAP